MKKLEYHEELQLIKQQIDKLSNRVNAIIRDNQINFDELMYNNSLSAGSIKEMVEKEFGLKIDKLAGRSKREIFDAKKALCYLLKEHTTLTLKDIRTYAYVTDHTSVLYNIRRCTDLMEIDKEYKAKVERLQNQIDKFKVFNLPD